MRDLRIVFMGTPDFAVASLKAVVEANFNVIGIITAPDKPAGRGRKLNESAVKQYAKANNLPLLQPTNLKNDAFIKELKALKANLQIVVAFRMLPKVVWQMPEFGTFNLHASLLPNYRGAAPINWVIINGETKTGVSTFFIDEKIDTGEMILQKSIDIKPKENAGSLHNKLMVLGSELVLKTLELINNGPVATSPQKDYPNTKTAYKLDKDNCKIYWTKPVNNIYNLIRGLSPYPAAWCKLHNNNDVSEIKIYEAEIENEIHNYNTGTIISTKKEIRVAVAEGYLKILKLKLPGKKLMTAQSLLNGYRFEEEAKML